MFNNRELFSKLVMKGELVYNNNTLFTGTAIMLYSDGSIMTEICFINGAQTGITRWYDRKGNVKAEKIFLNGTEVN